MNHPSRSHAGRPKAGQRQHAYQGLARSPTTAPFRQIAARLSELTASGRPRGDSLEKANGLLSYYQRRNYLTPPQVKLAENILSRYADHDFQNHCISCLSARLAEGKIRKEAGDFVSNVIRWYADNGFMTPLHLEQVIGILRDTGDFPTPPEEEEEDYEDFL